MKRVLIVGSRDSGSKNDPIVFLNRLKGEADARLIYWEDMRFTIKTGSVRVTVHGEDVIAFTPDLVICLGWYKNGKQSIYRDVALAFGLVLQHNDIKFWNSEITQQRSTTKLSCLVQLALEDIPVVPTEFSLTNSIAIETAQLPFIAKAAAASRGNENYLVKTSETLAELQSSDTRYLIQPFVPNDHDLRVICVGAEARLVLERRRGTGSDSHMNNTSQGGKAVWLPLDSLGPEILTLCNKICKVTKRELAGIDLIPDASSSIGYSCLEVNAIPQLTSGFDSEVKIEALVRAISTQ